MASIRERTRPAAYRVLQVRQRGYETRSFTARTKRDLPKSRFYVGPTFHDLRHTAISLMAVAGWRPEHIARQVGHADGGVLILRRYRHLFSDELAPKVSALDALLRADQQHAKEA